MSVASGDLKAARGYFEDGLLIRRRLADADPDSAENQRDLSISFNKLGNVSMESGDLKAARGYFEDDLRISRRLAETDPDSAVKERDLWVSHYKIADVLEREGHAGAMEHWKSAHEILAGMVASGLHVTEGDLRFLETLRGKIGG